MTETRYVISWPIAFCLLVVGGLVTIASQYSIGAFENIEKPEEREALDTYRDTVDSCRSQTEGAIDNFGEVEACSDMARKRLAVRARTDEQTGDYMALIHREMRIYQRVAYEAHGIR